MEISRANSYVYNYSRFSYSCVATFNNINIDVSVYGYNPILTQGYYPATGLSSDLDIYSNFWKYSPIEEHIIDSEDDSGDEDINYGYNITPHPINVPNVAGIQ